MKNQFDKDALKRFMQEVINQFGGNFDFAKEFRHFAENAKRQSPENQEQRGKHKNNMPPVNLIETADAFVIEVAAPGLVKENFSIQVLENSLVISHNYAAQTAQDVQYKRREFDYAQFERSFKIPEGADKEEISARYENGILEITILKKISSRKEGREIRIV